MGQVIRMMNYDRAGNMASAVSTKLYLNDTKLVFHRLDDGVMGGRSNTNQEMINTINGILFAGTIDTNGGGFTSIRSPINNGLPADAKGIRLKYKGDGKTYKVLLSEGNGAGGPWASSPSWQADLKTKSNQLEEQNIDFSSFKPSFGGRGSSRNELDKYIFKQTDMRQIGFMLSLKLSNGDPNPVETFGEGIFDFRLEIHEINVF